MDRVLGGGFVPGSAILLGGDPGIGKSTLLLQALTRMADHGLNCIYASGEESLEQIRRRAARLGVLEATVGVTSDIKSEAIADLMTADPAPHIVVVDSIQMLVSEAADAAAGTPSQMRAAAHTLIQAAKRSGVALVLVGHVTKDSTIAGPKQIEHMVDAVLRFDQETDAQYRILRASKNRFGSTDEVGVFEMRDTGLSEVSNPSEMFLVDAHADTPGSAIFPGLEGTRPMLVEVQTLVAATQYGTPRRTVVGWDQSRLSMLVAVLEARCGLCLSNSDIYMNVSGGVRLTEPAADLAVAAALVSAASGRSLPRGTVWFGEVGLGGEVRPVAHADRRLREAQTMGYASAYAPPERSGQATEPATQHAVRVTRLLDVVTAITVNAAA